MAIFVSLVLAALLVAAILVVLGLLYQLRSEQAVTARLQSELDERTWRWSEESERSNAEKYELLDQIDALRSDLHEMIRYAAADAETIRNMTRSHEMLLNEIDTLKLEYARAILDGVVVDEQQPVDPDQLRLV